MPPLHHHGRIIIVCLSFPTPTIGIKYVQIQNTSTTATTAVLYGHVFLLRLMPVQELKKNSRVQVTCKTVTFRFFLTYQNKSTLVQPTESRELHTNQTIVDGEKKSPTAITPRCPDNRRELRVHATTVYMYVLSSHIAEYKTTGRLPILFT